MFNSFFSAPVTVFSGVSLCCRNLCWSAFGSVLDKLRRETRYFFFRYGTNRVHKNCNEDPTPTFLGVRHAFLPHERSLGRIAWGGYNEGLLKPTEPIFQDLREAALLRFTEIYRADFTVLDFIPPRNAWSGFTVKVCVNSGCFRRCQSYSPLLARLISRNYKNG